MEHELIGVLGIRNASGELVGVLYNDMKKRSQILYTCTEAGVEDFKQILDRYKTDERNNVQ